MSIAITFSGMLGDRPTVSDLFRRPERENRPPYMVSSVGDVIFWLPGQNTTIGMPTPLNGHGRVRRCVDGSLNMPPEFSAGFHAGDTSRAAVERRPAPDCPSRRYDEERNGHNDGASRVHP